MKEGTRFWIVRPRVGFGGVSGLGTLLSGAYVEFDPGEGQPAHDFVGLAEPPPITSQVPGTQFVLQHRPPGRDRPRRARLLPRHPRRSGTRLRPGGGQSGPDRQGVRRRPERSAGAAEQPVLERERRRRVARYRRRRCRDRVAGGVAHRRHRVRHAGHRPAGRGGRCRYDLPAVRQFARRDRGGLHPAHPLPGPLRRLGPRPARRGPGRVPRHSGRYRDRRPARDRPSAGYRAHSGDPRDRAATDRRRARRRRASAMSSWPPWSNAGCARS